jgi:hypothetical protein
MKKRMHALLVTALVSAPVLLAANETTPIPLNDVGKKLELSYSAQLEALKKDISKALPQVDSQKKEAYLKAAEAESTAHSHVKRCQAASKKNGNAYGVLGHRKKWIADATGWVAQAKEKLKKAEAIKGPARAEAVKAAQDTLKKTEDGYKLAGSELKKAQALVEKAELAKAKLTKDLESATKAFERAKNDSMVASKELGLKEFLESDALDAELVKYVVLFEATPKGLAEYAQQGEEQGALIEKMLADTALMKQMVVADGAKGNKYGPAMKIYTEIQKASAKAGDGVLQRLALAISLEHAVPLGQRNATSLKDAPKTVDPVKRYLSYEKAYLADELDPAFKDLTTWDLRFVVDGGEPDEIAAWGREMLRCYRPDHISNPDYRWRYVGAVRTEVPYTSAYKTTDKDVPELQFFQNIIMNGGICGRRAFFGRFILRSFGIPTIARPSPGHGALAHWTPKGWVVCLGGGWGAGSTRTRYKSDLDFLASTQARNSELAFLQVKRAQWIGDVLGEKRTVGLRAGAPPFWNGVALYVQQAIIEDAKAVTLAAVGTDIAEATESKVKEAIKVATITDEDQKIIVGNDGTITIPAAACSKPTNNTRKIKFMPSNLGGKQLHYGGGRGHEEFEYTFDVPTAGKYALSARVATPNRRQHLFVSVNGSKKIVDIALSNTVGMWDTTEPVEVALVMGKNVLKFSRAHKGLKGLTIKDFTLGPAK